jgi:hypothetical protein
MGYLGTKPANSPLTSELIPDGLIATSDIADGAITTAKIAAGAVVPADLSQPLTLDTAKASTSGTFVDFTSIPSWVKRVTVMFAGVSTNGSSVIQVQLGDSGGVEVTGYLGCGGLIQNTSSSQTANFTSGFGITGAGSASSPLSYLWVCAPASECPALFSSGAVASRSGSPVLSMPASLFVGGATETVPLPPVLLWAL